MTIQLEATEQYFPVVLFTNTIKVKVHISHGAKVMFSYGTVWHVVQVQYMYTCTFSE